jgi:nucleolar protein 56
MWLWYDWRAAAVADSDGNILDVEEWDGWHDTNAVCSRMDIIAHEALTPEAERLLERFPDSTPLIHGDENLPDAEWPLPSNEALEYLDKAAILLSKRGVDAAAGDPDRRLEHILKASDELRASYVTIEGRLVEWVGLFLPEARFERDRTGLAKKVTESSDLAQLAELLDIGMPPEGPTDAEWASLKDWATSVSEIKARLDRMENVVRELASSHLPSLSALLGPILAARLCVEAHGRARLARLPAGTMQILGAEKAFFNHLKTGAPSPKHGHIFMHPWISRSPRWVRGKIARTVAAKASIAARCDAYGGEIWSQESVDAVAARVEVIRSENSKPPQR